MIFIFDWGHVSENKIGPLSSEDATFSLKAEFVWLVVRRKWFRAFFIPTIPTETKYFFISDEDHSNEEISKSVFEKYRSLAKLNRRAMDSEISDEEYRQMRTEINTA